MDRGEASVRSREEAIGVQTTNDDAPSHISDSSRELVLYAQPEHGIAVNVAPNSIAMSIGLEITGRRIERLFEKNSTFPSHRTKYFTNCSDDQRVMTIRIVEGESHTVPLNWADVLMMKELKGTRILEELDIKWESAIPRGRLRFLVNFQLDSTGDMRVVVDEKRTLRLRREICIPHEKLMSHEEYRQLQEAERKEKEKAKHPERERERGNMPESTSAEKKAGIAAADEEGAGAGEGEETGDSVEWSAHFSEPGASILDRNGDEEGRITVQEQTHDRNPDDDRNTAAISDRDSPTLHAVSAAELSVFDDLFNNVRKNNGSEGESHNAEEKIRLGLFHCLPPSPGSSVEHFLRYI